MLRTDIKAISQFINKAIDGEDIVLKFAGAQFYSHTYVADAVSGLFTILFCGKNGEANNISDGASDIMLRKLATIIAGIIERKVIFEITEAVETAGYSTATEVQTMGWKPRYDIRTGMEKIICILRRQR